MSCRFRFRLTSALGLVAPLGLLTLLGCGEPQSGAGERASDPRPNILMVVWDTVRADHLSLYGYERETTPHLDEFAKGARVFDNCLSTAPITVSSHAAMFTGLLPTESGASNAHQWLNEAHVTLAELLAGAGYRTFAWSANPHLSREENFTQGFEVAKHPWDEEVRERARAIVEHKVVGDRSNELGKRLRKPEVDGWTLKAAGELAEPALLDWLASSPEDRPFFAFVNYMEAHRPLIPPRALREVFMTEDEVARSYRVDVSWIPMWAFSFGLSELPERDLATMASVYDAALLELDGLFDHLLGSLRAAGQLENTVIVLTSDHGEHLGDHHMLDHQFSVFDSLLAVPLVVHYPARFAPGRDASPVANFDLFPTLLELAGVEYQRSRVSGSLSLLEPAEERARLAEFPAPFTKPFRALSKSYPDWDPEPWKQSLRALSTRDHKLIRGSAGRRELYLSGDESRELSASQPAALAEHEAELGRWVETLKPAALDAIPETSAEHQALLDDLGYSGQDE